MTGMGNITYLVTDVDVWASTEAHVRDILQLYPGFKVDCDEGIHVYYEVGGQKYGWVLWDERSTSHNTDLDDPTLVTVRIKTYDHTLYTLQGEHLPVAKSADYIEWGMHNRNYDLDKVMELLEGHPHVAELSRQRIPHYNVHDGQTEYVSFRWTPDAETYRKAQAWVEDPSNEVWHRMSGAVRALDLLGLVEGGAWIPEEDREPWKEEDDEYGY